MKQNVLNGKKFYADIQKMLDKRLRHTKEYRCLFGSCENCSKIENGQGIHIVETYEIYKCKTDVCGECDGWGTIDKTCGACKGTGKQVDLSGEGEKLVGTENILVKK